jgi:serine/threonine protein kinase
MQTLDMDITQEPAAPEPLPPPLAGGRYVLQRTLGAGGMATVYLATDTLLQVERAVKLLAPRFSTHLRVRQRFLDEARTMARLRHPNIVTVFDVGMEGERPFIVMELIEGGSLMDYIHLYGPADRMLAIEIMQGVLAGIELAHDRGVIHRDIKPHNVLLGDGGVPKVTDFGIARVEDREDSLTRTGTMMGTLAYMAPEQRRNARGVGAGADVYAAGATLYVLLTGRDPFDLYSSDLHDEIFEGVPEDLTGVLKQACRYRPEHRYASAAELRRALMAVAGERTELPEAELPVWGPIFRAAPTHDGHAAAAVEAPQGATAVPELSSSTFDIGAMDDEVEALAALRRAHSSPGTLEGLEIGGPPPVRTPSPPAPTDRTGVEPLSHVGSGTVVDSEGEEPSEDLDEDVGEPAAPRRISTLLVAFAVLGLTVVGGAWWWSGSQAWRGARVDATSSVETPPVEREASEEHVPALVPSPEEEATGATVEPGDLGPFEPAELEAPPVAAPVVPEPASAQPRVTPRADLPVVPPPPAEPEPEPEPGPTTGHGYINARPFCRLVLDGVDRGVTGWNGELEPGTHRFTLTTEDGRVHDDNIEVVAGEPTRYCWDFGTGASCR